MNKTLDQVMRENSYLETYIILGGQFHFDNRNIVLCTPGLAEETLKFSRNEDEISFNKDILNRHISYMEEQFQSQAEFDRQMLAVEQFELTWGNDF